MSNNNSSSSSGTPPLPPPQGLLPTKSQKSRRKISLPWFRQNSVSSPRAALSRQHTIDSPGSFRFFRQPSTNYQNQVNFICNFNLCEVFIRTVFFFFLQLSSFVFNNNNSKLNIENTDEYYLHIIFNK